MPKQESKSDDATSLAQDMADQVWRWLEQGRKPEARGKDGFPIYPDDPLAAHQSRLGAYLKQTARSLSFWKLEPENFPAGRELLGLSSEEMAQAVRAISVRLAFWKRLEKKQEAELDPDRNVFSFDELMELVTANREGRAPKIEAKGETKEEFDCPLSLRPLVSDLLRSQLPLTADDLAALVDLVAEQNVERIWYPIPFEGVLHAVERQASRSGLPPLLRQRLDQWRTSLQNQGRIRSADRKLLTRLCTLLGQGADPGVEPGEAWSNAALDDLKEMSAEKRGRWLALLQHCQKAETSKPTQKWAKAARELVAAVGLEAFKKHAIHWFELVALPRPVHREPRHGQWVPDPDQLIAGGNAVILKGLAWCFAGWQDAQVSRALSTLAEVCFKKVRWLGPRCPKVGNACLYSLSVTPTDEAAAQLSRLDSSVKQPTAKKRIDKSLTTAATLTGQTKEDLEEKAVPTFGLDQEGTLIRTFGSYHAEIRVKDSRTVVVAWSEGGSKPLKSVPAEVKRSHAGELKELQKLVKDIDKMLAAQRIRVERLMTTGREWELNNWRQRYLDQPLLAPIARRLIWHFKRGDQTSLGAWL